MALYHRENTHLKEDLKGSCYGCILKGEGVCEDDDDNNDDDHDDDDDADD